MIPIVRLSDDNDNDDDNDDNNDDNDDDDDDDDVDGDVDNIYDTYVTGFCRDYLIGAECINAPPN